LFDLLTEVCLNPKVSGQEFVSGILSSVMHKCDTL